ncbi:aminotransferase-like domain-containing protein [Streptomyces nigra]
MLPPPPSAGKTSGTRSAPAGKPVRSHRELAENSLMKEREIHANRRTAVLREEVIPSTAGSPGVRRSNLMLEHPRAPTATSAGVPRELSSDRRPYSGVTTVTDFVPGTPDVSLFPRASWAAAQRSVLAELPHQELGYPDPRGLPRLRTALAALLARRRGVVADPERIVVLSGVSQAMAVLGSVLHARGIREVGVEDPGSPQHAGLYAAAGVRAVPLPLDDEGPALGPLRESGVRCLVTTPAHQFPTGIACSARRRAELLDWAREVGGFVLEDDYDGDFRYDRAPVGALQGLDPERVAYSGSVSKSLAPGLRLGWLLVPEALAEEVVERKRTMDLGHPTLDQAVFARFVERGDYDRQLRHCQRAYRERRDALVTALGTHFPGSRVTGIAAGLHVIAALPARYGPEERFLTRAAAAGVAVRPLTHYTHARAGDDGEEPGVRLVLGYAHLPPGRIRAGVELMAGAAGAGGVGR